MVMARNGNVPGANKGEGGVAAETEGAEEPDEELVALTKANEGETAGAVRGTELTLLGQARAKCPALPHTKHRSCDRWPSTNPPPRLYVVREL